MTRRVIRRTDRCLCGLAVRLHYTQDNRRLTCEDAQAAHRYASIKFAPLRKLMLRTLEAGRS